jgi:hypothetical protein
MESLKNFHQGIETLNLYLDFFFLNHKFDYFETIFKKLGCQLSKQDFHSLETFHSKDLIVWLRVSYSDYDKFLLLVDIKNLRKKGFFFLHSIQQGAIEFS